MSVQKKFNYDEIETGYYDNIYKKKTGIRSAWHHIKFLYLKKKIDKKNIHLDIGCGPGTFLGQLKNTKCYGVDTAKKQIQYAEKHYKNNKRNFLLMKKTKIPLKSKSVDSITIIELIEHLNNNEIKLLLKESHRVLKKNGKILITTPNYFSMWPLLEFIINSVSDLSYKDQHINKFNIFKIKKIFDKKKFKILNLKSFILLSPFVAFLSFDISLRLVNLDNLLTKIIPGHLLFLQLKKF